MLFIEVIVVLLIWKEKYMNLNYDLYQIAFGIRGGQLDLWPLK